MRATTLKRMGHVAFHLGLTQALSKPMVVLLGAKGRGRIKRELDTIAQRAGGEDVASLLAFGDDLLAAKSKQPLKAKLLTLARSFLVRALERREATPDDDAAAGSTSEPPVGQEALQAWAEANRVVALLDASVYAELNPLQPKLFSGMVDHNVENGPFRQLLGDPDLAQRTAIAGPRLERLQSAAWAHLQLRAQEAETARKEIAAAGLATPPQDADDSARAQLIRQALAARDRLLPQVLWRPAARVRSEPYAIEDGSPPVFVHTETPEDRYAFPTRVRVALTVDAPLNPACSAHKTPCSHQLEAVHRLLDVLQNGTDDDIALVVDPVSLPAWSRALKAIDAILAVEDAPETSTEGQVSWGVNVTGRRPEVGPWLQVPLKSGGLGKARRIKPDKLLDGDVALDPDDRHIAELLELFGLMPDPTSGRATRVMQRVLGRLVGHPRVLRLPEETPLTVRHGALTLVTVRTEGHVRLLPSIDDQVLSLDDFRQRLRARTGRVMLHLDAEGALVLVDVAPSFETTINALAQHDFRLPEDALPELIRRLPAFASKAPVVLDRDVPRISVAAKRHLVLRASPRGRGLTVTVGVQPLPRAAVYPPGEGSAEVLAVDSEGQLTAALRDKNAEPGWVRSRIRLLLEGAEPDHQQWRFAIADPQDALTSLAHLQAADDVTVEWPGGRPWQISAADAGGRGLRLQVRDRRDWFGVQGDVDVDGHRVGLDNLVDAVRQDATFVAVAPGHWARISDDLRAHLAALEPHVGTDDGEMTVTPAATEALEALGGESAEFVRSVRWQANLDRLEAARQTDDAPLPNLKTTLRDYQQAGFHWMLRLATWGLGACLADDMGLGKTLQALAILSARAELGPQIVVAPTSVVFNWVREAERFAPDLRPVLYIGTERSSLLDDLGPRSLLITSYGLVVRDSEALASRPFASLVLDEAQAIKNAQSQRSKAVRALEADWRLALSGTPVENHLGELWALFATIAPGLLGSWPTFRERFVVPIERDGHRSRAEALSRLIRPFVLRRTKQEVATELPPRTTIDLDVVLTDAEQAAYEKARTQAVAELAGTPANQQARFQALAALTRLRQLACHPRLIDPDSALPSSKLARLMALVQTVANTDQRALIFSQFTRHLDLVREALDESGLRYLYLDGQTPAEERARRVARFQDGESKLFLISLKAGGTGLTLTGADTVIHLDPWWNPAVEDQATDRAHRIGQTKPVTVYRLIARHTIEEGIVALHRDKRELVAQVLDGTQAAGGLSTDELIGLIRNG